MSMSSTPGWYPDPTGGHQLRYFDGNVWTEHVSDNGVQSMAPVAAAPPVQPAQPAEPVQRPAQTAGPAPTAASPSGPPPKRRGGALKWIVAVVAVVVVLFIGAVVVQVVSDDKDKKQAGGAFVDAGQSFCEDFAGTWSDVSGGMIAADAIIEGLDLDPNYSGAGTDATNEIIQGAQDASVIAGEAPDDIKDKVTAMSQYLQLGVQLAQGDTSVVDQMLALDISSEDSAELAGSVPVGRCANY
jgi:Protein of unknown function (DUF2510)